MNERVSLPSGITLERIIRPAYYFKEKGGEFEKVVQVVRAAFGTPMTQADIYEHLTKPEKVYLFRNNFDVLGMCSYTSKSLDGDRILLIEGIAIEPKEQGRGLFIGATQVAHNNERFLALKTQNPRMHRALEKACLTVYPNSSSNIPENMRLLMIRLAKDLNLNVDSTMVARGFYGRSLYPIRPAHQTSSSLFDDVLKVDYDAGDSVLCLGINNLNRLFF